MKRRPSAVVVLVIAGVVGLLGLLAYGVFSEEDDGGRDFEAAIARGEREPAPDISLPPLDGGEERSLSDWRGQVVVLNYWASWCEPCKQESPLLERWHHRLQKRNGTVLGIDVLDVTSDAEDFIARYDLSYPHLRDNDGSTMDDFGVIAYPETFVIDRQGRIAGARRGEVDDEFLRSTVLPLLEGQS